MCIYYAEWLRCWLVAQRMGDFETRTRRPLSITKPPPYPLLVGCVHPVSRIPVSIAASAASTAISLILDDSSDRMLAGESVASTVRSTFEVSSNRSIISFSTSFLYWLPVATKNEYRRFAYTVLFHKCALFCSFHPLWPQVCAFE